jgi:hypothetical protein
MRHGLDFVDLKNPKVGHPAVCLEQAKTRCTTFLSMSIANVCEMMRAIRGQPNRGLRDLSSTIARMTPSSGPFGPGFFEQGLEENRRRYLRRTNAR